MEITFYRGTRPTPQNIAESWEWLCETVPEFMAVQRKRSDKLAHDSIIFGRCEGSHLKSNVRFLSGLAADFDIGPDHPSYVSFADMCDRLEREGHAFIAYTTTANGGLHNCYRLLMPYARDVEFSLCQRAWHACNAKFGGTIDKSTKNENRLSFLPAEWTENPYDSPKGIKTLCEPFSAVRVNVTGKPILSGAEIDGLGDDFWDQFAGSPVAASTAIPQPRPARASTSPVTGSTAPLSDTERQALAKGQSPSSLCWRLLGDFDKSPLVTDKMRNPPPFSDDRLFKFLGKAAWIAVKNNFPITVDVMLTLAEQFCARCLGRALPAEAARRAEDALAFAFRNAAQAAPCQPDC